MLGWHVEAHNIVALETECTPPNRSSPFWYWMSRFAPNGEKSNLVWFEGEPHSLLSLGANAPRFAILDVINPFCKLLFNVLGRVMFR